MFLKLTGLKTTLWSALALSLAIVITLYSVSYWQPKIFLIEQVLLGLFIISIIFSAQFSRSRFSILTSLWALYYLVKSQWLPGNTYLNNESEWLFLSGVLSIGLLVFIKDRGLLSLHGFLRLFLLVTAGLVAKAWLIVSVWLFSYLAPYQLPYLDLTLIKITLPLAVIGALILFKSLRSPSLLVAALLTSLVIWVLIYYQQLDLPLSVIVTLLLVQYILVVVIDSYYLAYRDELTGLPSRRSLNQLALSLSRQYTVAMLDIDHFKKFNDTYGHDIGDQVLKLVAAKLAQVKSGGRVFRYGGEEFTIVFPRKASIETIAELERLRQSIADYDIAIRHPVRKTKKSRAAKKPNDLKVVSVTISIGVATRSAKESFEHTLKRADQALYRAKKAGRNNVSE
ncbi:GGDEF domain-containing protein [Thalassotalea piscium]|uniref:diguanylate cyclase n=1 Tax=Thalassotalea piscium TaxID=1230533 RepID=A0A7X0TU38_9GAMM|nr:diguanylate cyclase [Thalassotalea piscium]MBB6543947.1 diguanylate cyclase (GGDEF)-like protein [Thalassotalea piscium]